MKRKITHNIVVLFTVSVFFLLCSAGTLQAADMPVYERFQPITEAVNAPTAVTLDLSDNIYVTESSNNRLLVFSPSGRYLKLIAGLDKPIGVAVSSDGRIFITNAGRGSVEVYDSNSALLYKLGSGDGEFTHPVAVAVDSAGNAYVADGKEDTIKVYDPDGSFKFSFGTSGSGDGQFNFPTSISINEPSGEVVISDLQVVQSETGPYGGARIQVFDMNGGFKRSFGAYGLGEGKLVRPLGVAADGDGRIYVTDAYQNVVQVFDSNGVYLGAIYDHDNPLRTPLGLAYSGKSNRLFIASLNTFRVEVYGIDIHIITASAGSGGTISPSEIVFVKHGESQSFTITPDENHQVADVKVDGSSVGAVATYTFRDVTASHAIEASFAPKNPEPTVGLVGAEQASHATGDGDIQTGLFEPSFAAKGEETAYSLKHPFVAGFLIVIGLVAVVKRRAILSRLS